MATILSKWILSPAIVLLSVWLFPGIHYPSPVEPVITGLLFAMLAHLLDLSLLRPGTFWAVNLVDFAVANVLVYTGNFFFPGTSVSVTGTLLTAFSLTISEYFLHQRLLSYNRADL
jgi:hypothetical protein